MDNHKPIKILKVKDRDNKIKLPREMNSYLPQMKGEVIMVVAPIAQGKCLCPNQLVELKNSKKKLKDIKIGDLINSKNGFVKVKNIFHNGKKECYEIFLKNNTKIIATLEHKIETQNGMKPIKEIENDYILCKTGYTQINYINYYDEIETIDLEIDHIEHSFFCNDISVSNSNFVSNWFLNPELAQGMFDTIYFLSNTAHQDDTSRFLIDEPNVIVFDDLNSAKVDDIIDNIIETQKQYEKKDMPRIAIIFDDIIGSLSIHNSKAFSIASRARHYNILNLFYIVQKFKSVNNVVRNNITHLITFAGIYNNGELKALEDEFSSVGGNEGFTSLYKREVQSKKYNFLYGNLQTGKTYLNFDKLLNSNFTNETE